MAPQLSVIMSAYNSSETIERAVISILSQSFSDFELIIMNDGSTDDTEAKILSFSDERIRYFLLDHAGLTKALNFGLSKATVSWSSMLILILCERHSICSFTTNIIQSIKS